MRRVVHGSVTDNPMLMSDLGQSLILALPVTKGVSVLGTLDSVVPRPVMDGKVIAKVWPLGRSGYKFSAAMAHLHQNSGRWLV